MEYEIYQVNADGSKLEVTTDKINETLVPSNVIILIDHTKRKIYNFNGRESGIRVRFIGARMAAGPIRGELGLTYAVTSVDEGEETNDFREFLKSIASPGSAAVSRILDRPPPPPPPMRPPTPKAADSATRSALEPRNDIIEANSSSIRKADLSLDGDVESVIKEFGETPEGHEVEAIIVKDAVYKNFEVQTSVFGKAVAQNRLERVKDIDGIFVMDGQVKVIAKNGVVTGIQILSRQTVAETKKTKASAE